MDATIFIGVITVFLTIILGWGFRNLPGEKWQIMASMPKAKQEHGGWVGKNLTYYGLLSANAYTFGVLMLIILLGAVGIPVYGMVGVTVLLLAICIPASTIIARVVEKKAYTLTVGGASFAGIIAAPWVIAFVNGTVGARMGFDMPVIVILAAVSTGYAYGEGLGRLACISFGCCYGKPLDKCHPLLQKLFSRFNFVYVGKTKKISYTSNMEGIKTLPIQAVTSVVFTLSALCGTWLFLNGFFALAFIEALMVTQLWRVVSELFRSDYRGGLKFTAYQTMAVGSVIYSVGILFFFPSWSVSGIDLAAGLKTLWTPGMLLFLQAIWAVSFLHTGRSNVTESTIRLDVVKARI